MTCFGYFPSRNVNIAPFLQLLHEVLNQGMKWIHLHSFVYKHDIKSRLTLYQICLVWHLHRLLRASFLFYFVQECLLDPHLLNIVDCPRFHLHRWNWNSSFAQIGRSLLNQRTHIGIENNVDHRNFLKCYVSIYL